MIISAMVKSSLIDYPGLISCVLFVPDCNYNCFYCHNRSLIDGAYDILQTQHVTDFLKKRAGLLSGVVITGGEPTLQQDLIPFMKTVKNLGYQIKLDTNGSMPDTVEQILHSGLCDYFAVDYKAPMARYQEICGEHANAQAVLKTLSLLMDAKVAFEVRTTVIPQLSEKDLLCMANELPIVPRYVLNRYRPPDNYLPCDQEKVQKKPYLQSEIEEFAKKMRIIMPNVTT